MLMEGARLCSKCINRPWSAGPGFAIRRFGVELWLTVHMSLVFNTNTYCKPELGEKEGACWRVVFDEPYLPHRTGKVWVASRERLCLGID